MKTQILISINRDGLKDVSLIAETEKECEGIMETYRKYEPEILNFLMAMRRKSQDVSENRV